MADAPDINSSNIHDRVAAVNHLGLHGTPDDVALLLGMARTDKSPGVRLGAASAATDILSRYRLPPTSEDLSRRERLAILDAFRGLDPGINPAVLTVLGALGMPRCLDRLLIGLRDPRYDVRNGAGVALQRYCISWSTSGDDIVRAKVIGVLEDRRTRPDVLAHVAKLCARCGWQEARPKLERHLGRTDQVAEAVETALALLDAAADPAGLSGTWRSTGLDAGEVAPAPREVGWMILEGDVALYGPESDLERVPWAAESADALRLGEVTHSVRRMHLPSADADVPTLQLDGRTWTRAEPADVAALAERLCDHPEGAAAAIDSLLDLLPTTMPGRKLGVRLRIAAGRGEDAAQTVEGIISSRKKPGADLFFLLGESRHAAGDTAGAREAWEEFLVRSKGKGQLAAKARARLEG